MDTENLPARQGTLAILEPVPAWHPEKRLLDRWPHLRRVGQNWAAYAAAVWGPYLERQREQRREEVARRA
jgi:hypothetical protein